MAETLRKFGKYFLLDIIAQGGMAEIYRARDQGGRLLAIKRIIPSYSASPEFVTMFRSEIKTTSGFTNPNIVQVYDYGEEKGLLYIAMELVDGKNLRQFISRFAEIKHKMPTEVAIYIIEQAAAALNYAHSFKDKISGKNLNIVHRDIKPQNILISYDGAVKLIDFGIAKAVTNVENTRSGIIKGTPNYLSPEQIAGDQLDGRSDVFELGIVFWELLTSRRLFSGENDYSVLKAIENCNTTVKPPSLYNSELPKDLDAISMRMLQREPGNRFSSAEELQRALHRLLYQNFPEFNPADLAHYARDLFKDEIVQDRKKLLSLNDRAEKLLEEDIQVEDSTKATLAKVTPQAAEPKTSLTQQGPPPLPPKERGSFRQVDIDAKEITKSKEITLEGMPAGNHTSSFSQPAKTSTGIRYERKSEPKIEAEPKSTNRFLGIAALVAILAGGYYFFTTSSTTNKLNTEGGPVGALQIDGNVRSVTVAINGSTVANSLPAKIEGVPAGQNLKISVFSNGYQKFSQDLTLAKDETKTLTANLVREDSNVMPMANPSNGSASQGEAPRINVKFNISPVGGINRILVNGLTIDQLLGMAQVAVDAPFEVSVEHEGFRTFHGSFKVESAKTSGLTEWPIDIQLQPAKFGYLSIKTTPSADAVLSVDGAEERITTPVSRKRMPVGTYQIKLVNTLLQMEKDVSVDITEDHVTSIDERLQVRSPSSF